MNILFKAVAAAAFVFAAWPSHSQSMPCGSRDAIVERLGSKYGEQRVATGLSGSATMMEVFANEETGSWTILITHPDGQSCLVSAGEHFSALEPVRETF
jgi:hypothetical protein